MNKAKKIIEDKEHHVRYADGSSAMVIETGHALKAIEIAKLEAEIESCKLHGKTFKQYFLLAKRASVKGVTNKTQKLATQLSFSFDVVANECEEKLKELLKQYGL